MGEYRGTKSKPISSKDFRKKIIVAEIKKRTNCTKVTMVAETATHYRGSPLFRDQHGRWENNSGDCFVEKDFFNFASKR